MNFKEFSALNLERCTSPTGFGHELADWSAAEWTNAIAGEVGEACNLTKKLIRHRDGVRGNLKSEDQSVISLRRRAAKEIADAMIYSDLAIQALGFNTDDVVTEVFNSKSREIGWISSARLHSKEKQR
jgi:NTP pyrophosphatase (non-canonical NTP hydrolase)